ncbi:hypothetical protein BsWGS_28579 [Bradybaena similaris]
MTAPILIKLLPQCVSNKNRDLVYRYYILVFTFFCYTSYHLSRKPISVVKSVLHHDNCSHEWHSNATNTSNEYWCDWAPFNTSSYLDLLGTLDLCYLISYALAMFISGHISDRMNLRYYLSAGMLLSGIFTVGFGLGYFYNVHDYWFYVVMQVFGGIFQATGWPGVVACVGNWFGKGKRGLIMGIWNAHTSIGNILGSFIAGAFVEKAWGLSFVVPGVIIGVIGVLVFLFLVPDPADVGCRSPDHTDSSIRTAQRRRPRGKNDKLESEGDETELEETSEVKKKEYRIRQSNGDPDLETPDVDNKVAKETEAEAANEKTEQDDPSARPISIFRALLIPGVIEFSLCLFFAKLVSYTFLYWLPKYLSKSVSATEAAYVSTIFDAGGIIGGIAAGYFSDKLRMRATICILFLVLVAPVLFLYNEYGSIVPFWANCVLLAVCGAGVNGPYALITTAVSADLGTHKTLRNSAKALGMVSAIIDGTGSIGAAIGPMLTGVISGSSHENGWKYVFYMLIGSDFMAAILLSRVMVKEILRRLWKKDESVTIIVKSPDTAKHEHLDGIDQHAV